MRIFPCKLPATKAHIDHALMSWNVIWRFLRAQIVGFLHLVLRTIVEVRPVWRGNNGVLRVEEKFGRIDTSCTDTCPDLGAGIVCGVAIEVPTMPILPWLRWHGDLRIQVITFTGLIPPIYLERHRAWQGEMNNMELLTSPPTLQDLTIAIQACLDSIRTIVL